MPVYKTVTIEFVSCAEQHACARKTGVPCLREARRASQPFCFATSRERNWPSGQSPLTGAAAYSRASVWMKRENNSPCELIRSLASMLRRWMRTVPGEMPRMRPTASAEWPFRVCSTISRSRAVRMPSPNRRRLGGSPHGRMGPKGNGLPDNRSRRPASGKKRRFRCPTGSASCGAAGACRSAGHASSMIDRPADMWLTS